MELNIDSRQPTRRVVLVASRRVVITAHIPIYFDQHQESMCNFPKVRIINMLISETQFPREVSSTRRPRVCLLACMIIAALWGITTQANMI